MQDRPGQAGPRRCDECLAALTANPALDRDSDPEREEWTGDEVKVLPVHPSLYQINTPVWLTELSRGLGRAATLDDIPDAELDRVAGIGFQWVWLLSVWRTGPAGQRVLRSNPEWRKEFRETLPDLREKDIAGSGFAITGYYVAGTEADLARAPQNYTWVKRTFPVSQPRRSHRAAQGPDGPRRLRSRRK